MIKVIYAATSLLLLPAISASQIGSFPPGTFPRNSAPTSAPVVRLQDELTIIAQMRTLEQSNRLSDAVDQMRQAAPTYGNGTFFTNYALLLAYKSSNLEHMAYADSETRPGAFDLRHLVRTKTQGYSEDNRRALRTRLDQFESVRIIKESFPGWSSTAAENLEASWLLIIAHDAQQPKLKSFELNTCVFKTFIDDADFLYRRALEILPNDPVVNYKFAHFLASTYELVVQNAPEVQYTDVQLKDMRNSGIRQALPYARRAYSKASGELKEIIKSFIRTGLQARP